MCLGVPGRIVEIRDLVAVVDFWGMRRDVRLELVDQPVAVGDYILNHVGYAIRRIPEEDIAGTLALYEELLRDAGATEDLMTADVRAEMEAARPSSEASLSRREAPSPSSAEGASPSRRAAPSPSSRAAASPSSADGASPSSERSERALP